MNECECMDEETISPDLDSGTADLDTRKPCQIHAKSMPDPHLGHTFQGEISMQRSRSRGC